MNHVFYFVLDDYEHQRNISAIVKEQGELSGKEMIRLLDSIIESDSGLFRKMFTNGLFGLMGTENAFKFGLKLILLRFEQVIEEQEK